MLTGYYAEDGLIATLEINNDSKLQMDDNVVDKKSALYLSNKAKITSIKNILTNEDELSMVIHDFVLKANEIYKHEELNIPFYLDKTLAINQTHSSTYADKNYTGKFKQFHTNGQIYTYWFFKDGKKEGKCIAYYDDGKKCSEINYTEGRREGLVKEWYENGNMKVEMIYVNDIKEGESTQYYESGEVRKKCTYKNNKLEGDYLIFNENGKLRTSFEIVNGKKHGLKKTYQDGKLKSEQKFANDVPDANVKYYMTDKELESYCNKATEKAQELMRKK